MKNYTIPTLLSASAFALMFTSCDRDPVVEAEADKVESQADYVEDVAEAEADKIEGRTENKADAVREQGEAQADQLEERADQIRDTGTGTAPAVRAADGTVVE